MLATLLVTAGIGLTIVSNNSDELESIYARTFFDRASDRPSYQPREKSFIAFESRRRIATDRVVTPVINEALEPESPVVDDGTNDVVASLDASQPARVEVVKSEPLKVDVALTEVNVETVIAPTQEMIDATSAGIPASEVTESSINSATTPVESTETTWASYNVSLQDAADLTGTDLDGQATCADQNCDSATCAPSRKFGTAIEWAEDAKQAARLAKEHDKLVFLIQVSGNFAREEFT